MKMTLSRLALVRLARVNAGLLAACFATSGIAQSYPVKPVRVVHSFQAGGITDLLAR